MSDEWNSLLHEALVQGAKCKTQSARCKVEQPLARCSQASLVPRNVQPIILHINR